MFFSVGGSDKTATGKNVRFLMPLNGNLSGSGGYFRWLERVCTPLSTIASKYATKLTQSLCHLSAQPPTKIPIDK